MQPGESRQIEILRVLCVISMMWVHVNPGLSTPSIVSQGDLHLVGDFLGNTLGRISVVLLSFVSGYLFWLTSHSAPFLRLARRRFVNVMIPVLVWSAIFIVLAAMKGVVTGYEASSLRDINRGIGELLNAWTGIAGPTANRSLFFLRDLFIATLITRAIVPAIERAPAIVLLLVLALTLSDLDLSPVIFRNNILEFMVAGACFARLGITLDRLSRPGISLLFGYLLTAAGYAIARIEGGQAAQIMQVSIFFRRVGISLLAVALTSVILRRFGWLGLERLGRFSFLAFLMHVPVIGLLWVPWLRLFGGENAASYLPFYLFAPIVAYGLAVRLGLLLDRAPAIVQIALRGKVQGPNGRETAD